MTGIVFSIIRSLFTWHSLFLLIYLQVGISELLIANVMQFYIGTSAVVAMTHGNTEIFSTTSGVLQSDTLAPFLFITLLDYVLHETLLDNIDGFTITPHRSSRYPAFELVLSCMLTTSQSLVTQLTKPKMFFDASK